MHLPRKFLLIPIVILAFMTSCTATGSKQTTNGSENCFAEAGFCIDFPSSDPSTTIDVYEVPAAGYIPALTEYTAVITSDDGIETYSVYVSDEALPFGSGQMKGDSPVISNRSLEEELDMDYNLHAGVWTYSEDSYLRVVGMFMNVGERKYLVEGVSYSGSSPKHIKEFMRSFVRDA